MIEVKHILVPVDGSETAMRAVRHAIVLAECYNAELEFLYVSHLAEETDSKLPGLSWLGNAAGSVKKVSDAILENAAECVQGRVLFTTCKQVGIPDKVIAKYAIEQAVDMIVIGGRGLGLVKGFLLGSVSQSLLENAGCPVVIVK